MPYDFTSDGYEQFSQAIIGAGGDQATLTSILSDMQTTFTDNIAQGINNTKELDTVKAENERLRKANMDLFLRVGEQQREKTGEQKPPKQEDSEQPSTQSLMDKYFENWGKK